MLMLTFVSCTSTRNEVTQNAQEPVKYELPYVADFDPPRYLGKWHEVARLPMAIQPADTLATAEYSTTGEEGMIAVRNTAYNTQGHQLSAIEGKAKIAAGDPPGRLCVSFGPVTPAEPNYYVIHVDDDYQYAVVGVPGRDSLWILARGVPISEKKLNALRNIADSAGFDVSKLIIAPWDQVEPSDG